MARSKIHLHGINTGIGNYMRAMTNAGIVAGTMSLANAGWTVEVASMGQEAGIKHHNIIRWPNPAGRGNDHPDEALLASDPDAAAGELYGYVRQALDNAPELGLYKEWFRVCPTNEISLPENDPSNVGHFLTGLAIRLNRDGYAASLGGFNAGQPEPEHWKTQGMRRLLMYLEANPQNTIALHEGKTGDPNLSMTDEIKEFVPHAIGRYRHLLRAADDLDIARPKVDITEFTLGSYNDLPGRDIFMRDVQALAAMMAKDPEVLTVLLWNIHPDKKWGGLPNELVSYMPALQAYNLQATFPDPDNGDPPPDEEDETLAQRAWRISLDQQVLQLNPEAALQRKIFQDGFVPTDPEFRFPLGGDSYAGQGAENLATGERRVYLARVPLWGDVFFVKGPDQPPVHIPHLGLTSPLSGRWIIGSAGHFDAYRDYSHINPNVKQKHEGVDGIPMEDGSMALAPRAGTVVRVGYSEKGYGNFVKMEHTDPLLFYTWSGHMADVRVQVGQKLRQGEVLGKVGSTGYSTGLHVHLTVQVPELGLDGYIVADVIDPVPHMDMTPIKLPPPSTGTATMGLHASADPRLAANEVEIFEAADVELIKILSNLDPRDLKALQNARPGATWIIRAFLAMSSGGQPRSVSPAQFFNDTFPDVKRAIDTLGLGPQRVLLELHNEPNLTMEGLGGSWGDGAAFNAWWLDLVTRYRQALPGFRMGFPGLSPGPAFSARIQKYVFASGCLEAIRSADWIADHVYWGVGETVQDGLSNAARFAGWLQTNRIPSPIYITEASDKSSDSGPTKGQRYVAFWDGLIQVPQIHGVTYFVASASHPDFQREVWTDGQQSRGIAEVVGQR